MIHVINKSQSLSWHETGSVLLKAMEKDVNLYPLKMWPYMLRLFFPVNFTTKTKMAGYLRTRVFPPLLFFFI